MFSMSDLEPLRRHGVAITTRPLRAGFRATIPNGAWLSVQWGTSMYGSNYESLHTDADESTLTAEFAEIAVKISSELGLCPWADGDTVQGWCSVERVQRVLDRLVAGTLIVDGVADDS